MSGTTALLIVDCQEDYFARPGLQPPREVLIPAIAAALEAARADGWPIFHVRTQVAADGSNAMPHRRSAPEAVEGTAGAAPPAELAEQDEPLFFKRFFSAFDADGLEEALRAAEVSRLLLAGVHSHACIQATALDAYARGFEVLVGEDLVGSYDPVHAAAALDWLGGRAAAVVPSAAVFGRAAEPWVHRNPCDWEEVLGEVAVMATAQVADMVGRLRGVDPAQATDRAERLADWHRRLSSDRGQWVDTLIRDLGKPRVDAEGEVAYGLGLLAHVAAASAEDEDAAGRRVSYRPHGLVGLITPWNNPFAIPIAKLAPALVYSNAVLWKPALPGSRIARLLHESLLESGLGESIGLTTGDAAAGRAVLDHADALSFTGSVGVGRVIIAEAARRAIPVQAELGGSNAAIIDASADLDLAAQDLAAAMFSFAGQRCTAIRRIIVLDAVFDAFLPRLAEAVAALRLGDPADAATQVGPVIDKARQQAFQAMAANSGAQVVAAGTPPTGVSAMGCWVVPTVLANLPARHPLLTEEVFGPLAAVIRVADLDAAIAGHNGTAMGLLGAFYTSDEASERRFVDEAEAGILSINRARPQFSADGPFGGLKASGFGIPEHGRWNRDFYTRPQAIYRD